METPPDLVDSEVANMLPWKSVDVRDDGHPGYLRLHLFIAIMIIMAMTINLSGDELKENIGGGIKLFNRQTVGVPLAFWS